MKQTAVEFLEEMMTIALGEHHMTLFINEFNKAKKIEKEQIMDFAMKFMMQDKPVVSFYNETFKSEESS